MRPSTSVPHSLKNAPMIMLSLSSMVSRVAPLHETVEQHRDEQHLDEQKGDVVDEVAQHLPVEVLGGEEEPAQGVHDDRRDDERDGDLDLPAAQAHAVSRVSDEGSAPRVADRIPESGAYAGVQPVVSSDGIALYFTRRSRRMAP